MFGLINISEAASIAIHAGVFLAGEPGRFWAARRLAGKLGCSIHHLMKVIRQLVRAGLLEARQGPAGGVCLARRPDAISVLDIYIAAGGQPEPPGGLLKGNVCRGNVCLLGKLLFQENRRLIDLLRAVSLASIADSLNAHARSSQGNNKPLRRRGS